MKINEFLYYICSCWSVFLIVNYMILVQSQESAPRSLNFNSLLQHSSVYFSDEEVDVQILLSTTSCSSSANSSGSAPFHFGFYRPNMTRTAVLAILIFREYDPVDPAVVWYADVSHPVQGAATLDLSATLGLVLRDGHGHDVWSTVVNASASGRLLKSMNLTCQGNLVLLTDSGGVAWQSFDHPTDTWLLGQTLDVGQTLRSRVSTNDFSAGNYYISLGYDALHAFVDTTNPAIEYGNFYTSLGFQTVQRSKVNFSGPGDEYFGYLRVDPDGHLNSYTYTTKEYLQADLLQVTGNNDCGYPNVCGSYGVCFRGNVCGCPEDAATGNLNFFKPVDPSRPGLGCTPITPLACSNALKLHTFVRLEDVSYFGFESYLAGVHDIDSCKAACLRNCSCKAAFFHYGGDMSSGNCSLPTQLLTLMHLEPNMLDYNSTAFIKVQRPVEKATSSLVLTLVTSLSAGLFIVLCVGVGYYVMVLRRKFDQKDIECSSDVVIDTVAKFSFESLRLATQDFQNRLGRGGFGSVFEGTLDDGTKVAVKRLDSIGQGRKEFLAEVNSIGILHHYNLVRLIGFCDDGLNRLLVYEFMPNGSLDKWIFNQNLAQTLTWALRQRIIGGIAKGLEYLHENCLQNVIHFNIKPQNILLGRDFHVKISDFGLAKMVDRDQSQVLTIIRGTPGYMAPELITARVTSVKVDVYSFGVMVLEIVCGRRNFGSSESDLLTNLVKVKADEDLLSDLIDECAEDMQQHKEEAIKMMKIAIWCLQPHFIRPNMSMVVKVLQDLPNMDALSDLSYLTMVHEATPDETNATFSTCPTESILSGPR